VRQLAELGTADFHVKLKRCRIRMDRHDGHLRCCLVDVETVGDQLRFSGIDEIDEPADSCFEFFQRTVSDIGLRRSRPFLEAPSLR